MTLLFSDLVDSTRFSELVEPEHLRDVFSRYRAEAKEAVERYGGRVMQYTGDGILAGFGYPNAHEDDAQRAVLAGIDLVAGMKKARTELEERYGVAARVRVGLHTGRVVVTDLSEDRSVRERDAIVGAAPNLAARIQHVAKPDTVVISDVTKQLVESDFYLRSLGTRELKGIARPVEVFAVERPRYLGARFDADRYRKVGLVGRDEPRNRLFEAWERVEAAAARRPAGEAFLVVGPAGIGKTRLVAEAVERVAGSGGHVLGVGCLPYYSNVSLWPVGQMLDRALGVVAPEDRLDHLVDHVVSLGMDPADSVPFLAPLIGLSARSDYPEPELDPSALLEETLNRLVDWLTALAGQTPHLFIAEDLHWGDPSTIRLMGLIVEQRPPGILTVATTRDDSILPWRDSAEVLELSRLDNATSSMLVERLAVDQEVSDRLRASIVERAEGIPLYIEELTRSYLQADGGDPLPLRLQEILTGRLKGPGLDLRVAQVAATIGPMFDAGTVSAVIGDEALVASQLSRLAEEGLVDPGDPGTDTYRFKHSLLRDAAYETQVLETRSLTHARVAHVLAERAAAPALIAEHLDLAGDTERAVTRYLIAAQAEQARGAHSEATRLLSRTLELIEQIADSDERDLTELTARMLRGLSVSSTQGYAAPDVQADHRRAEQLATRLGTRPEVLPSLIAIWAYWLTSGDLGTAEGLIERLMGMVGLPALTWFEPEVQSCAGWLAFYQGRLVEAQAHLERAMTGFQSRPSEATVSPFWPLPNDPVAVSGIALACVASIRGETDQAARWEGEAIERAEKIGFPRGPFSLAFVKTYAAWIRRLNSDPAASRALGAEVVAIGLEHGYAYWVMLGSSYVGSREPQDVPDREHFKQMVNNLRAMGQEAFVPSSLAYLAELNAEEGNLDRALELIAEALQTVEKTGERLHLPELLRFRASYSLARGDDGGDAVADLREAIQVATDQGARVSRLRAAIEIARLPEDLRPEDWHDLLEGARREMPSSFQAAEASAADDLIAD